MHEEILKSIKRNEGSKTVLFLRIRFNLMINYITFRSHSTGSQRKHVFQYTVFISHYVAA